MRQPPQTPPTLKPDTAPLYLAKAMILVRRDAFAAASSAGLSHATTRNVFQLAMLRGFSLVCLRQGPTAYDGLKDMILRVTKQRSAAQAAGEALPDTGG